MVHQAHKQELVPGTITHTIGLLSLWSQRPSRGLAKVEFSSDFARQKVIKELRYKLKNKGIVFYEIKLPQGKNPSDVFNFILKELEKLEFGVVSISGFETVFSDESIRFEFLRVLNFNRENLAKFNLRQIWWMSWDFNNQAMGIMPDLNSWFSLRLYLSETPINIDSEKNITKTPDVFGIATSALTSQLKSLPNNLPIPSAKFIGREQILRELHQGLQQNEKVAICALMGMGGVGKTELALQYAWQEWEKKTYPGGICWLNALHQELGLQILSFARNYLQITPPEDGTLSERVRYCWQNWPAGNVLIIFDDVRDYGQIEPYLPPINKTRFKIIVTTRFNYISAITTTINLNILTEVEAIELLKVYVTYDRIDAQLEQAKLLCRDLDYLPLALKLTACLLVQEKSWTIEKIREKLATILERESFIKKDDRLHKK